MSAPALPLAETQAWMQAVLVHPEGAEVGLSTPEARQYLAADDAPLVIRERGELTAPERLQIYAGMYPLRMSEALRSDFPALAALLGDRSFERLVGDYVAAHPSRSFTLARLGDHLPEFVTAWTSRRHRSLLADVARLELAAVQVFDAVETAPLDTSALKDFPVAEWTGMTLVPAPAFRLVSVHPGAVGVLDAVLEGTPIPLKTGRGRVQVAYYRKEFVVRRRTLGPFEGSLLASLIAGETFGESLEHAARIFPGGFPSPEVLSGWFADWTGLGFFTGIEPSAATGRP
jgi:hypothetical protein